MEVLIQIKEKLEKIIVLAQEQNINISLFPILVHIERAEYFYSEGKSSGDEQFFTDVVYRTNQAFEGCSRQAFMILAEKTEAQAQAKKAWEIETFFTEEKIFSIRVKAQFENYRDQWRNESAHNFKLFFDESEAFYAILSVSSYAYFLFNQIIQKLAYNIEVKKIQKEELQLRKIQGVINKKQKPLKDKIARLIEFFNEELKEKSNSNLDTGVIYREEEIIGMLTAYIQEASKDIFIETEKRTQSLGRANRRADIYLELGEEKLVIEIKRGQHPKSALEQIQMYLKDLGVENGIIYSYISSKRSKGIIKENHLITSEENTYNITTLH